MKTRSSFVRILAAILLGLLADAVLAQPIARGQINFGPGAHAGRLNIQGAYLFMTLSNSDLRILDIADRSRPTLVGQLSLGSEASVFYGTDVEIAGDFAYVRSGFGIAIVDIRDKTNPTLVTRMALSSEPLSLDLADGLLYVGTTGDLSIFSLANPTSPLFLGSYPANAQIREVVVANHTAFCAAHSAGFLIIDVSDPNRPTLAARVPNNSPAAPLDLALDGNRAYVSTDYELKIFDVSNPAAPSLLGQKDLGVGFFSYRDAVAYANGFAFIHGFGSSLQVVDVRNPTQTQVVVNTYLPGSIGSVGTDILVDGDNLFVANGTGGLRIFDISNPSAPLPLSNYILATEIKSLLLAPNVAYAANAFGEILVIDCSVPSNPAVIARVPTLFPPRFLVTMGNRICSVFQDGFELYSLQNPLLPTFVGRYLGPITDVAGFGNYAFLSRNGNIDTLDISNPSAITVAASYSGGYGILDLSGPFLAASSGASVSVFNAADPLALRPIGVYHERPSALDFDGNVLFIKAPTIAPALRVAQNSVVLAGSAPTGSNIAADSGRYWVALDNLTLVDARNVSNAITKGSVPVGSPLYDLAASGSFAATAHGSFFALYEGALPNPQLQADFDGTQVTIRWPTAFPNYSLFATEDPDATWQVISPPFPQENGYFTYTDRMTAPMRFYRLQIP